MGEKAEFFLETKLFEIDEDDDEEDDEEDEDEYDNEDKGGVMDTCL